MSQVLPGDLLKLLGSQSLGSKADLFPHQPPRDAGAGAAGGRADHWPPELVRAGVFCGLLRCGLGAAGKPNSPLCR